MCVDVGQGRNKHNKKKKPPKNTKTKLGDILSMVQLVVIKMWGCFFKRKLLNLNQIHLSFKNKPVSNYDK